MDSIKVAGATIILSLLLIGCDEDGSLGSAGSAAPQLLTSPNETLNILVIGGTSGVGLETVKLALNRGHVVSAMSRNPEKVEIAHANLTLVKGDTLDPVSVESAIQGQDAVVFSVGMPPTREKVTLFSLGTENVLSAMTRNNVDRILLVSGIGAGESRGHGGFFYDYIVQPLLLKTIYEDKDRSERLVKEGTTRWTIVRPGFLDDTRGFAEYRVIEDLEGITSGDISRADVAHFMVSSLESSSYIGATVLISN